MVVLDIPLLIENKLNKKGDILIFVKTKRSKIIKRLKKRKNYNKKILDKLRSNQSSLLKKERLSYRYAEQIYSKAFPYFWKIGFYNCLK